MADYLLDLMVSKVCNRLRRYTQTTLCGCFLASLTGSEIRAWQVYCRSSPEFAAVEKSELEAVVLHSRICGGDLTSETEAKFRQAVADRDAATETMRGVAAKWYEELCAESPRPRMDM